MNRLQDPNRIRAGDELYLPYRIGNPEGMLVPPWPRATNAPATPSPAEETHAESAENAEPDPHAGSAEGAE